MSVFPVFQKDPDAVLDYSWDWSDWLPAGDTISSHTASVISGDVTINTSSNDTTSVTVWLAAGTDDTTAQVQTRIVTAQGRTDDRTIILDVQHR